MATTVQKQMLTLQLRVAPETKNGFKFHDASVAINITGATNATPIVITTQIPHNYNTGEQVNIQNVGGNTNANNTTANPNWTITVLSATTFSLNNSAGNSAYTSLGTVVHQLVGSVDGSNMPAQSLLDIYNFARIMITNLVAGLIPQNKLNTMFSGNVATNATFEFASGIGTKPAGYLWSILLQDSAKAVIPVFPASQIRSFQDQESATNRAVFDAGNTLYGLTAAYYPNASTYLLVYYGITQYTISDVLGNATTESYNDQYLPLIIEVAQMLADEAGQVAINKFVAEFLGLAIPKPKQ